MKLSKMFKIGAVALMVTSLCFVGCKDEDENDTLDGYSISYGHPSDASTTYARSWNVTHTNHLSADCTITIDRTAKTTKGDVDKVTTTDGGNNAAYIFGLTGSGTAEKPYSFGLIGFRLNEAVPQYFISWYTGVQSSYCNTDINDFDADDSENTAYEYILVNAWTDMPLGSYNLSADTFTVYVDLDAIAGDTPVTADNYSTLKDKIDGYQIKFGKAQDSVGNAKILKAAALAKDNYEKKLAPDLTEFKIEQTRVGFYAMVSKGKALVAKLDFNNDSIVKSVYAMPHDDFGKTIELNGEILTNIK